MHLVTSAMPNNSLIQYRICLNNKIINLCCYSQYKKNYQCFSSGIIQGSCLDPILFYIYINPLLNKLKGVASVYADDIKYAGSTVISTKEQIQ